MGGEIFSWRSYHPSLTRFSLFPRSRKAPPVSSPTPPVPAVPGGSPQGAQQTAAWAAPALPARLSREQAPRDAGRAGRAGLPQLCRPSPALPACLFSRLGQGHKRHYRLAARSCFSRRKSHFGNQRSGCLTQPAGLQLQVCTRSQPGSASFPGSTSSFGAEGQSKSIRPASQSHPRDDLSSVQCTRSGHQSLAQVTAPHQAPNPQRQTKVWSHT